MGILKKIYHKLSRLLHPDKCAASGAEEAFKRLTAAFTTLSDAAVQHAAACTSGGGGASAAASAAAFMAMPSVAPAGAWPSTFSH